MAADVRLFARRPRRDAHAQLRRLDSSQCAHFAPVQLEARAARALRRRPPSSCCALARRSARECGGPRESSHLGVGGPRDGPRALSAPRSSREETRRTGCRLDELGRCELGAGAERYAGRKVERWRHRSVERATVVRVKRARGGRRHDRGGPDEPPSSHPRYVVPARELSSPSMSCCTRSLSQHSSTGAVQRG